ELRAGRSQARDNQRLDKRTEARGGVKSAEETRRAQCCEDRGDVTVRPAGHDFKWPCRTGCERGATGTAKDLTKRLDAVGGPIREISNGSILDLAALPIALAQQHGGARAAVGDGGDVHD